MFGKFLSVANDSAKILEQSEIWSYVHDDKLVVNGKDNDKSFKESDNWNQV